jgi:hypothetical protein
LGGTGFFELAEEIMKVRGRGRGSVALQDVEILLGLASDECDADRK